MGAYIFGDIHGHFDEFSKLLSVIQPKKRDWIITLGDYIDRGPKSKQVIAKLIGLRNKLSMVNLRGNHEQMMIDARNSNNSFNYWMTNGGIETMKSYNLPVEFDAVSRIPKAHWDFINNQCVDIAETDRFIFVHGGLQPNLPVSQQPREVTQWTRFENAKPHSSGKVYFCGHTPQEGNKPKTKGFAVCLDTGVYFEDGWLSCLRLDDGMIMQANRFMEVRQFPL